MRLSRFDLTIDLPRGWEGRIHGLDVREQSLLQTGGRERPVAQMANFPLPADPGDFGGQAVHLMGEAGAFISLVEHGPDSVGTALFSDRGLPRNLTATSFHPRALQRTLPGQGGFQHFFTESGRAFCLYVVVGNFRGAHAVAGQINRALSAVTIGPNS